MEEEENEEERGRGRKVRKGVKRGALGSESHGQGKEVFTKGSVQQAAWFTKGRCTASRAMCLLRPVAVLTFGALDPVGIFQAS